MATADSDDRYKSEVLAARRGSEVMTSSPMDIILKEPWKICCHCCYIYTIKLSDKFIDNFSISFLIFEINYLNFHDDFSRHVLGQK